MRNNLLVCGIVSMIILCADYSYAAGIYENANQSAEFIRTLTRYASTEIDAAFYNPAGTALMENGYYIYFSDQMLFDYQRMTDSSDALSAYSYPDEYKGEAMTWAFPDIYALYKKNRMSLFLNLGLIGRGAAATYDSGLPVINKGIIQYAKAVASYSGGSLLSIDADTTLEAYAFFIGATIGGAYKLNEQFSIGGGFRYVHAEQNTHLKYNFINVMSTTGDITPYFEDIDVDVDADGDSCGFIGSLNIQPVPAINIGTRFEYYTTMKVKNDCPDKYKGPALFLSQFPFSKGEYTKMTLPMNAAIGISYMLTPDFKVEGGFIYYFNKEADWGKDNSGDEISEKYDNGYDASFSVEYAFIPQFKASMGYSYSISGVNSKTRNNEQLGLDANTVGIGGKYTFAGGIDFTLATMVVFFKDTTETNASPDTGETKYEDRVYSVAGSVSYRFL